MRNDTDSQIHSQALTQTHCKQIHTVTQTLAQLY